MKVHFFQRHYVTMWVTWEMRSAFQIRRRGEEEWKTEGRVIPLRFFHSHSLRGLPSVERELRSTHITTTSSCTIASWYNLRPYKGCLPPHLGVNFFALFSFFFIFDDKTIKDKSKVEYLLIDNNDYHSSSLVILFSYKNEKRFFTKLFYYLSLSIHLSAWFPPEKDVFCSTWLLHWWPGTYTTGICVCLMT